MDVLFLLLGDDVDIIDIAMALVLANDEDEENDDHVPPPGVWGGSRPGKARNLEGHHVRYSHLLFDDFWGLDIRRVAHGTGRQIPPGCIDRYAVHRTILWCSNCSV